MKTAMERFLSGWRNAKESKANLVLLASGCLLLVLSLLWRMVIAPAVRVFPADFDQVHSYRGTLTVHNPPPGSQEGEAPTMVPITIEKRLFNPTGKSTTDVLVVQVDTETVNSENGKAISSSEKVYAMDRKSGEMVDSALADEDRSGYYIVFPFDTPREPVEVWNNLTRSSHQAGYVSRQQVEGMEVYHFLVEFADEPLSSPPGGYPASVTGKQLRQFLFEEDLPVGDDQEVALDYLGSGRIELLVEPEAGTVVEVRNVQESVSLALERPESGLDVNRLLYAAEYGETDQSLNRSVQFAREEKSKLRLQFVYLPLGFLVLGIVCLLVGALAGTRRREGTEGES